MAQILETVEATPPNLRSEAAKAHYDSMLGYEQEVTLKDQEMKKLNESI